LQIGGPVSSAEDDIEVCGDTMRVNLWYPGLESRQVKKIEVGLMDVRAADSIRIEYDFDRDGWSVQQASTFEWHADDKVCDSDWQEVAFIEAWAREKPNMDCYEIIDAPQKGS
jgi:hypothetical protein